MDKTGMMLYEREMLLIEEELEAEIAQLNACLREKEEALRDIRLARAVRAKIGDVITGTFVELTRVAK